MGEMPELKPCPFCGSNEVHVYETLGTWTITCDTEDCFGSVDDEAHRWISEEVAIAAWNTRSDLSDQRIAALEQKLAMAVEALRWALEYAEGHNDIAMPVRETLSAISAKDVAR